MLKLKLITAILASVGLVSLLLGDTYLTVGGAVVCTTVASIASLHLTLRWTMEEDVGFARFFVAIWSIFFIATGIAVLQGVNILNTPLGANIDSLQKAGDVGCYVSCTSIISVILAVIAPWSPPKWDDDDSKG